MNTVHEYDALGHLVQVIEAPGTLNYLTTYTYDALGNLKQVLQSGQTRTFTYDSLSRLRTSTNPESNTNTYTYDDNGNLLTKVDARSITTQTSYDGLNRPTFKTYTDGTPTVRYCYDGFDYDAVSGACTGSQVVGKKGRLTATGSAVSVTRFTAFDDLGRITASQQATAGGDYNFIYGYNKAGGLEVQQYPSGRQVETCYDNAGRVDGLTNLGGPSAYASGFSYAPHGALAQLTLGNNLVETTSFNNRLQPFRIEAGGLLTLDFEYNTLGQTDNNGNVLTQKIDAPGLPAILTQTYTYDGVNRLASITETGGSTNWNRAYGYDAYGNRAATGANVFANTPQSLADFDPATNQLTAAWAGYDLAGNLTSFNKLGFEWTAAYDADNLQSSFTSGSTTTTYEYDGDGRRVKKLQGSRTTVFVYDAFGKLAAEYDTQPDPNLVAGTYYRTTDHLGSTRLVTDANGAVVSRRDFFPFGEEIPANATFGNRQMVLDGGAATTYNREFGVHQNFTGKEQDTESGFDYFGARYYSGILGRFLSPDLAPIDPLIPQSFNKYRYAFNNPLRYTDPNGLYERDVHFALTQAFARAVGFSASDAADIAKATQAPDDDNRNPTDPLTMFTRRGFENRRDFHFTSEERRDELWADFVNATDRKDRIDALGTFLHAFQDAFSHAGFSITTLTGQALVLPFPDLPDKTYSDPIKTKLMIAATYHVLLRAREFFKKNELKSALAAPLEFSAVSSKTLPAFTFSGFGSIERRSRALQAISDEAERQCRQKQKEE